MNIKPCKTFIGYSASECGRIFTNRRRTRIKGQHGTKVVIDHKYQRELKQQIVAKNYRVVCINTGKSIRPIGIHRIVMDAFIGPPPVGHQVRHLDNDPSNNNISNLAYGTVMENSHDRMQAGHYYTGGRHHNAKLTDDQAEEIKRLRKQKLKVKVLANQFSVSIATIESIIYGKSYKS